MNFIFFTITDETPLELWYFSNLLTGFLYWEISEDRCFQVYKHVVHYLDCSAHM